MLCHLNSGGIIIIRYFHDTCTNSKTDMTCSDISTVEVLSCLCISPDMKLTVR